MKLIVLNIWGGRVHQPLLEFLKKHSSTTDVFCFQEVYKSSQSVKQDVVTNIYTDLEQILSDFEGMHSEGFVLPEETTKVSYGLATFIRKGIQIRDKGVYDIFLSDENPGLNEGVRLWNRLLQFVTLPLQNSEVTIFNFHGLWTGDSKEDHPGRLRQSTKIRQIFQEHPGKKIICGDFNLNPETQSMKMLEEGMRNLITEAGITSTRSLYYTKEPKFADYILLSPEIHVQEFEVLDESISDHLPLFLDFDVVGL